MTQHLQLVSTCLLEEEISNMRSELEKYGIQMPAFSKIGGILANELSVDEAACKSSDVSLNLWLTLCCFCHKLNCAHTRFSSVHAAVIAINDAVDRGQTSVTMGALNNPNAMLKNIQEALAQEYQDALSQAKARKQDQSSGRVRSLPNASVTSFVSVSSFISFIWNCWLSLYRSLYYNNSIIRSFSSSLASLLTTLNLSLFHLSFRTNPILSCKDN